MFCAFHGRPRWSHILVLWMVFVVTFDSRRISKVTLHQPYSQVIDEERQLIPYTLATSPLHIFSHLIKDSRPRELHKNGCGSATITPI